MSITVANGFTSFAMNTSVCCATVTCNTSRALKEPRADPCDYRKKVNQLSMKPSHAAAPALTERQRQVMKLRSTGLSYRAIGRKLGISGTRAREIMVRVQRNQGQAK
jgi:DNA-binding NarL/FixJ family response regulator